LREAIDVTVSICTGIATIKEKIDNRKPAIEHFANRPA
jgi:hypothetical protein